MVSGFEDHSAYAQCIFAFCEHEGAEPKLFVGRCEGKIVPPRGENMFGWDPVFQPNGYEGTYAEITAEEKHSISHRGRALVELKKYLRENKDELMQKYGQ